ncbi:glycerophosphodiester phosphodiesterase family protein [Parerythrobacter aestuarii]|uniref:glycerophosphodiester phosphodiesterase family protein n=1 Tax=Parerythrobacter aestuarii TaxID=3020909 RepID=UPI0024DEF305|nr:glycerophosphodiester phosphodiesterase family protein [Parerythrobacter aestuarii]
MKRWLLIAATLLAVAFLTLTVVNASWLAPVPVGNPKLIAHRGLYQLYDHEGVGRDTCTADRIEQPQHDYLENTTRSIRRAARLGASMVEVDIAPTKDGEIAVFHDWTVDCRTNGSGDVRELTMEQLKALDAGHGYTADGGKTYPFRGQAVGAIPALAEAIEAIERKKLIYNFKSGDAGEADLLVAKLRKAGRDPATSGDGFYGAPEPVARIRELVPEAWAFATAEARACSKDYVLTGWTGLLPDSCKGGTMIIPLNYQWAFWGWPNRLIARMEEHGGQVIVMGPYADNAATGLTLPEQLGEIPDSFNGWIWVEDGWNVIPARFPRLDDRQDPQLRAAQDTLERRRADQD